MKEHEHAAKHIPETHPAHDEVAKEAYDIYRKQGRPQGQAEERQQDGPTNPKQRDNRIEEAATTTA